MAFRTREQLLSDGEQLLARWCRLNAVTPPEIKAWYTDPEFDTCAYYRDDLICIWPKACATIGMAGPAWSYPGYVVDRTPYGVLQHELGHHVDHAHGFRGGDLAHRWRKETGEEPITTYCPNDNEWFAEIFRLFVTNPDLLSKLRPKTYDRLRMRWSVRAELRSWEEILDERRMGPALKKIAAANRVAELRSECQERLW